VTAVGWICRSCRGVRIFLSDRIAGCGSKALIYGSKAKTYHFDRFDLFTGFG
jgi:hypothetical protein